MGGQTKELPPPPPLLPLRDKVPPGANFTLGGGLSSPLEASLWFLWTTKFKVVQHKIRVSLTQTSILSGRKCRHNPKFYFSLALQNYMLGYETSFLGMKLRSWAWNFVPGHETSFLGMKLRSWAWNFVPGHETLFLGMKHSFLGMKLHSWTRIFFIPRCENPASSFFSTMHFSPPNSGVVH
jgi:hypothetical protein